MSPVPYLPPVHRLCLVKSPPQTLFGGTHSYCVTLFSCIVNLLLSIESFPSTSNILCLPPLKTLLYVLIFQHAYGTEFLGTVAYTCYDHLLFHSLLNPLQTQLHFHYSPGSVLLKAWMISMLLNLKIIWVLILLGWLATFHAVSHYLLVILFSLASGILYFTAFLSTSLATTLQSLLIGSCIPLCP